LSPILVRPVREQLEHDRVIRFLQAKCRRKYDVGINPGAEQNVPVGAGPSAVYPDLVFSGQGRSRRIEAIVEVETGESVNHLEALAEWGPYSRLKAPFHLYVPANMVDVARRLCEENQVDVSELWTYHVLGDQVRFTLVQRTRETAAAAPVRTRPAASTARAAAAPRAGTRKAAAGRTSKSPARGRARAAARKPARSQKRK